MSYAKTYYIQRTQGARPSSKVEWFLANYADVLPRDRQARICEIGPGMGDVLEWLVKEGGFANAVGLEIDADLAQIANQKTPGHCVHVADVAAHLRADDTRYDLFVMLHVLEHIEAPAALELLRTLSDKLAPGGALIVEVPNAAHPLTGAATFHADFTHRQGYTNTSLDQALAMAGFEQRRTGAVRPPGGGVARWVQGRMQALANAAFTALMRLYFPSDPPVISVNLFGIGRKA